MPSKPNGLVQTPTVSAPTACEIADTTGAAPVPVPPPAPAVTNTMSEPFSRVLMRSSSDSAAALPTAGSEPEPRPWVMLSPM